MTRPSNVLIPQHFGGLVFEHHTSRYLPVDHEAAQLLTSLIDQPLVSVRSALPPSDHDAVTGFVETFTERGWFTSDQHFDGHVLPATPPATHLLGPLATHVEVVGACNLTCTHCFASPLPRNKDPLTVPELSKLFSELSSMGSYRLGLTGGEPLMRRELLEIIDEATNVDLHPCLTTNGLLLTKEWAQAFKRRELVWLNISLDGATAATNDAIRGAGTFDRVISMLRTLGPSFRFTLAFTVMRHNVHEVDAFAQLAKDLGAHTVVFRPLYPAGAAKHRPELLPKFDDYADALLSLGAACGQGGVLRSLESFSPAERLPTTAKVHEGLGCGAGNTIATVSVRGDVNPCSFLGSGFDAANVRTRSFREIWNDSDVFGAMRGLSKTKQDGRFAGGCRARALQATGDVDGADPWQERFEKRGAPFPPAFTLPVLR